MAKRSSIRFYLAEDDVAVWAIAEASLLAGELTGTTRPDLEGWRTLARADPSGTLVALGGEEVVGFFSMPYPLLIVAPAHRRRRHGTRLIEAALSDARGRGETWLKLAPPRGNAGAAAFAARLGFVYRSSLWQLRLPPDAPASSPAFPPPVSVRPFRADDLPAYVALIKAAFADQPSPIRISEEMVRHVHSQPGFDPTDILLVEVADRAEGPVGFCRTKMERAAGTISGEIAFIGVIPEWQGRGLGTALLAWGIERLRRAGATEPTLSVEALNDRALRLYERTGFERVQEWPRWTRDTQT